MVGATDRQRAEEEIGRLAARRADEYARGLLTGGTLFEELGKHNIRVVGIAPGILEVTALRTPEYERALAGEMTSGCA